MNKKKFLALLSKKLRKIPKEELAERLSFYSEIIDDRMEEGLSEAEAVSSVGNVEEIAAEITAELGVSTAKEKKRAETLRPWEIALVIIGSPLWFPLLLAFFIITWSLIAVMWSVEIVFFAFALMSKYLLIACTASVNACAEMTKRCYTTIADWFRK